MSMSDIPESWIVDPASVLELANVDEAARWLSAVMCGGLVLNDAEPDEPPFAAVRTVYRRLSPLARQCLLDASNACVQAIELPGSPWVGAAADSLLLLSADIAKDIPAARAALIDQLRRLGRSASSIRLQGRALGLLATLGYRADEKFWRTVGEMGAGEFSSAAIRGLAALNLETAFSWAAAPSDEGTRLRYLAPLLPRLLEDRGPDVVARHIQSIWKALNEEERREVLRWVPTLERRLTEHARLQESLSQWRPSTSPPNTVTILQSALKSCTRADPSYRDFMIRLAESILNASLHDPFRRSRGLWQLYQDNLAVFASDEHFDEDDHITQAALWQLNEQQHTNLATEVDERFLQ